MPSYATASLLANRTVLRVSGADRDSFLQGLISNDIALCTPDQSLYAALLTPQGKFLHDLFFYHAGEEYIVDCEAARVDELVQKLSAYRLRAKVVIEEAGDRFDVIAFVDGSNGLPDPRLPALGSRGFVEKGKVSNDDKNYNYHRLALGVVDGSCDMIVGKSSLLDGNFDLLNGISWTKGCYVGQELTARMHHRALVKKRMFPVKISGTAPAVGAILRHEGVEVGEMRSSQKDVGLALLNIEMVQGMLARSQAFQVAESQLTPYQPQWMDLH